MSELNASVARAEQALLVSGFVRVLHGLTDPATRRDVVAVRCGPHTDLRQLVRVAPLPSPGPTARSDRTHPSDSDVVRERRAQCVRLLYARADTQKRRGFAIASLHSPLE